MKPGVHIAVSLSLGTGIWFFTKSLYAGFLCLIFGVLLDVDHILEYIIHHRFREFSIKKVYQACDETARHEGEFRFRKLYIVLHIWEVAILAWVAALYTKNIYILAIALGYTSHLILDCTGNLMYPYSYFITWRIINSFDSSRLFKKTGKI